MVLHDSYDTALVQYQSIIILLLLLLFILNYSKKVNHLGDY